MSRWMTASLPALVLAASVTAGAGHADTLRATGTLVFESHTSEIFTSRSGPATTRVTDRYTIVMDDLVVDPGDYDRYEIEISAGPGKRLEATGIFGSNIALNIFVLWGTNEGFASGVTTNTPVFVGGTGDLPDTGIVLTLGFGVTGIGFGLRYEDLPGNDSFGFESIIFSRDLSPAETRSGAFLTSPGSLVLTTATQGAVPDPGRFSTITPEPGSLALLALGGLALRRRRDR